MTKEEILGQYDRLQSIFNAKYKDIQGGLGLATDGWIDYCDEVKVSIVDHESIQRYFNESAEQYVCMDNPEPAEVADEFHWILVPLELAERALILGGIP